MSNYNRELQFIDNSEKAYLLGLFYSDGYVCSVNNNCGITLHAQDVCLLESIVEKFPFFVLRKSHRNAYKIECTAKYLKIDLLSNGMLILKSTTNRDYLLFPRIDESLHPHFIRGYFDGDGSVYHQKLFNIKIELGGTCFNLISRIAKILYDNRVNVNMRCSYAGEACRKLDYYKIFTSSYKESILFANYIYREATIFLRRKYDLLSVTVEYQTKERIACPLCGSTSTVYNGFRNNKTRVTCKDCKKRSSVQTAPDISNGVSGGDELLESYVSDDMLISSQVMSTLMEGSETT